VGISTKETERKPLDKIYGPAVFDITLYYNDYYSRAEGQFAAHIVVLAVYPATWSVTSTYNNDHSRRPPGPAVD